MKMITTIRHMIRPPEHADPDSLIRFRRAGQAKAAGYSVLAVLVVGAGLAGAAQWAPREGCADTIVHGDTLNELAAEHGISPESIMEHTPWINDPNMIFEGRQIDRCGNFEDMMMNGVAAAIGENQPTNAQNTSYNQSAVDALPGNVFEWAKAVQRTAPSDATAAQVRFLVAVSGPESNHGTAIWNPGDASADGKWVGSYGTVQVRVLSNPDRFPSDWFRDMDWLKASLDNQASAAWTIYSRQSPTAWGPVTDGKLPNTSCSGSSDVGRCLEWWAVADRAIALTNS